MNDFEASKKHITLNEAFSLIEEKLQNGGTVTFSPHGISMLPLLRQGKDSVTIAPVNRQLQRNDVVFYRRPGGQFVLHRIVGKDSTGYILCGDNQDFKEYGVKPEYIIGVLAAVNRGKRNVKYGGFWCMFYRRLVLPLWRLNVKSRKNKFAAKIKKLFKE